MWVAGKSVYDPSLTRRRATVERLRYTGKSHSVYSAIQMSWSLYLLRLGMHSPIKPNSITLASSELASVMEFGL